MPTLVLAPAFSRWLPAGDGDGEHAFELPGATVGELLDALFQRHPTLRGYVLDELGRLRHHVAVFVDGQSLRDKRNLAAPLAADAEVHVIQALSGG